MLGPMIKEAHKLGTKHIFRLLQRGFADVSVLVPSNTIYHVQCRGEVDQSHSIVNDVVMKAAFPDCWTKYALFLNPQQSFSYVEAYRQIKLNVFELSFDDNCGNSFTDGAEPGGKILGVSDQLKIPHQICEPSHT